MPTRRSETLAASLVSGMNMALAQLVDIWDSIGITEEGRVERMLTFKNHIEALMKDMVKEEEARKEQLDTAIETFQEQLSSLCLDMDMEPYKLEEGLTVLQTEKNLRVKVEALEKAKSERLRELQELREQDEDLCVELCLTPYYIPTGTVPSLTQMAELKQHIVTLTKEQARRLAVFSGLRQDISRLMAEMGHEPETSLERDSVCTDPDAFLLTQENIKALRALCCQLEMKRDSLVKTAEELKDRAQRLWSRLDCPEEERQAFQQSVTGTLNDKITQWRKEVALRAEQQTTKLEEVIDKVRVELVALWELCSYGAEQKEAFNTHFCDTNFTEELLALHDAELMKVQSYYDQAKPLLDTLQRWEKNFALFQDFEKRANDPNRFSNRGGALLKEGKERVKVQKILPKMEEELRSGAELWLTSHGSDFLVRGQKVTAYIGRQWDEYKQQRSKEKLEKTAKKGESTPLRTPTKRPHGTASGHTPAKIRKTPVHALQRSNSTSSSGSSSSNFSTFVVPSISKPPISPPNITLTHSTPSSGKPQLKVPESIIRVRPPLQEFNIERQPILGISYSDFTSELSRKASDSVLNSTVKDHI